MNWNFFIVTYTIIIQSLYTHTDDIISTTIYLSPTCCDAKYFNRTYRLLSLMIAVYHIIEAHVETQTQQTTYHYNLQWVFVTLYNDKLVQYRRKSTTILTFCCCRVIILKCSKIARNIKVPMFTYTVYHIAVNLCCFQNNYVSKKLEYF